MKRTIIIGDVHGCIDELKKMIKKVDYRKEEDDLYFVGDLINRGPDSLSCYLYFKELGAKSVMGNHERVHLFTQKELSEKTEVTQIKNEFGSYYQEFIQTIKTWPYYYNFSEFALVHAGFNPEKTIETTDEKTLCTVRTINDDNLNKNIAWFDAYHQEKLIVFGHWSKLGGIIRKNVIGLDRSCVYGGKLRSVILPKRSIIEVSAKHIYYDPLSKSSSLYKK